ncbi:MAG: AAA family ATPase [Bacteroidales bacterium]|nr:AAA family ATPase [Bacteroidales bacterium]MCF8388508.1 AAA family ATPase [Bacteroidales bacterium]MCF8399573.1 AAA family ATPase [Bacteroidales bacterium]
MIIIGITGTLGAGKGTIVEYLVKNRNFLHFSVREYLAGEIKNRGLPVNRDTLTTVANELREKNTPSYIIDELYKEALTSNKNCVIESIRTPGEVESLRSMGHFYLFAVDADPVLRYNRIKQRNSETDHVTYETFLANEKREMSSNDPNKQNLQKCREMADFVIQNESSIEDLHGQVELILNTKIKEIDEQ